MKNCVTDESKSPQERVEKRRGEEMVRKSEYQARRPCRVDVLTIIAGCSRRRPRSANDSRGKNENKKWQGTRKMEGDELRASVSSSRELLPRSLIK